MFGFTKKRRHFVSAVIWNAGYAGCAEEPGRLPFLGDMPVIAHSLEVFQQCGRIEEVVVVCREEELAELYELVREFGFDKVSHILTGGENRQEDVFAGVAACSGEAEYYAVHDGARPLVTEEIIEECLAAAVERGAAAAGVRSKDTVKLAGDNGFIRATPNRDRVYSVQTPHIFEAELYRRAMAQARREGKQFADDCELVTWAGGRVYITNGSDRNMKITTPADLAVAEAVLDFREKEVETWRI